MTNYYEILGLSTEASSNDIKVAFRQLAKIYHPDKNPEGKEIFTRILKAYETLSDPGLKRSYDYRLKSNRLHEHEIREKNPNQKQWRFDERELKRRQYYNEHIKKYAPTSATETEAEAKKTYNEFKYILFATPLAVALFLLIMKLATRDSRDLPEGHFEYGKQATAVQERSSDLQMGDAPYSGYFGDPIYDTIDDQKLVVKNLTGADIIVCLFTRTSFVRSFFVANNYSAEVAQLPDDSLHIRYSSGTGFDYQRELSEARLSGAFTSGLYFFKSLAGTPLGSINELTLGSGLNQGFKEVGEKEFFRKLK